MEFMRVIFVCLGNICRSPIAEGVLRHKLLEKKLEGIVASAGTSDWHQGDAPHRSSQKVCRQNGVDISRQKSQAFVREMFTEYDLIFAMDSNNYKDLMQMTNSQEDQTKIKLFSSLIPNFEPQDIPDPYYGDFSGYEHVYKMIDELCEQLIDTYYLN